MPEPAIDFGATDLTNCDHEPIHIPGSIQPHGALLTLDPDSLRIVQAGGDTAGLLGAAATTLLGGRVAMVLSSQQQDRLRDLLEADRPLARAVHAFVHETKDGGTTDVVTHLSNGLPVLEFDPRRNPNPDDAMALVQSMVRRVQSQGSLQLACDGLATEVRNATGFDRVMVYRFSPNGSGLVVAEARGPDVDTFLGLHYPASDIPKQARALYLANWIRHIPDARYAPAAITPPLNPLTGRPLDLSHSLLRSVSPIHRQYLANMGVVASFSLSLIVGGKLWGLVACHHAAPRYLPHRLRDACELFIEIVSSHLELKIAEERLQAQLDSAHLYDAIVARMSHEPNLADGLIRYRPNLLDFIPATGVGLWTDGRFSASGVAPAPEQIEGLVAWLNETVNEGVFQTDCLTALYPPARDFADVASGLLALSVSRTPRDYVLWFRPEISKAVTWAGNPAKAAEAGPEGLTLTPRQSFAAWTESVKLHASPWLDIEVDAAHRLRMSLHEVVLRRIEQMAREREVARQEQEALVRQLDFRLEEWRTTAEALKEESDRRAALEADLSQVLRRTVADQEAERMRVARELHDTLGQSLALLRLGLDGVDHSSAGVEQFAQRLTGLKALVLEFGRDLNRLAWEIRPTVLDDLGIQTAIQNLTETWSERTGIQVDLHLTLEGRRLQPEIETALYRVLQEALTNVIRHAAATEVGVALGTTEQLVTMIIEDNGRGFDPGNAAASELPTKRLGLLGMRERLTLVNGSLEIESVPGKGTTLFINIPLA
nr:GAF domain-containing protein [uncultured Rhodopila sp.]